MDITASTVSHAPCLLSPFDGLLYMCHLLYYRVVVQSPFMQKEVKLKMGEPIRNFELCQWLIMTTSHTNS